MFNVNREKIAWMGVAEQEKFPLDPAKLERYDIIKGHIKILVDEGVREKTS